MNKIEIDKKNFHRKCNKHNKLFNFNYAQKKFALNFIIRVVYQANKTFLLTNLSTHTPFHNEARFCFCERKMLSMFSNTRDALCAASIL